MNISSFALVIEKATERNHTMDHFLVNAVWNAATGIEFILGNGIDVASSLKYETIVFRTCAQLK